MNKSLGVFVRCVGFFVRCVGFLGCMGFLGLGCVSKQDNSQNDTTSHAAKKGSQKTISPKLSVFLVVDQLRADDLWAHRHLFRYGFKRLLDEGRFFVAAMHGHARLETASGHASLATGLLPKDHGVVDKIIYDAELQKNMRVCSYGPKSNGPKSNGLEGGSKEACYPHILKAKTLGDRLKKTYPGAKVVSLAQKDRSAMLMGGFDGDAVVWADRKDMGLLLGRMKRATGGYGPISKDVADFYADIASSDRMARIWEKPNLPPRYAGWKDDAQGEVDCGHGTVFPHRIKPELQNRELYEAWFSSPDSDRAWVDLALFLARKFELGKDETPDLLALSLGATDAIGHCFGPDSLERIAGLVELDRMVGDLLDGLDAWMGPNWVLGLSSDHGVGHTVASRRARGQRAERLDSKKLVAWLEDALAVGGEFGPGPFVEAYHFPFLTLKKHAKQAALAKHTAALLRGYPGVFASWSHASLADAAEPQAAQIRANLYPGRSGHVSVLYAPHISPKGRGGDAGAHHGTPWTYDRNVPVLIRAPHMQPGLDPSPVQAIDLSRSLADSMGLEVDPRGGSPLPGIR